MKQGWEIKKLGEVCKLTNGFAFQSKQYTSDGYFVIRIGNVQDGYIDLNNPRYIKPSEEKHKKFNLSDGDILISLTGNVGRVGIIRGEHLPAVLNQRVAKISIVNTKLDKSYLFYFLNSEYFITELIKAGRGAAQQNISTTDIENLIIPLPPLFEQQRIVALLDEAFAAIATAKANAEQNLKNTKELYENYLQSMVNSKSEGWVEKTLGEVCSLITDGKHGDCENETNSGYYFLSAKDVKNGTLLFDNARQITKSGFEETHRRTNLKPGDICMVNTGATIGRISFAPDDPRTYNSTFQKSVAVIKTVPDLINNHYCRYLLQSDLKKLVKVSSGTAVPNLLLGDLKRHKINLPKTLKAQISIVQKLDAISVETKNLETIYQQKINGLEELKKSVLQKAFNGELKTSDIEVTV